MGVGSFANVIVASKDLLRTNTLAYLAAVSATKEKVL
jgi:hypothetical protein